MTLFERMRALPEDCRAALRRASAWAVLAALLDAACGVLLVPLVEAWFAEGALPWRWVAALLGLSLAQALLQYLALRRGFAAGGSLAARWRLDWCAAWWRACRAWRRRRCAGSRRPKACCAAR
ncbi:hypothetical protein FA094_14255 [Pseudomonas aeruginosa]|nr:hypothetical protein [Pseudomonas aeruginosa]